MTSAGFSLALGLLLAVFVLLGLLRREKRSVKRQKAKVLGLREELEDTVDRLRRFAAGEKVDLGQKNTEMDFVSAEEKESDRPRRPKVISSPT